MHAKHPPLLEVVGRLLRVMENLFFIGFGVKLPHRVADHVSQKYHGVVFSIDALDVQVRAVPYVIR